MFKKKLNFGNAVAGIICLAVAGMVFSGCKEEKNPDNPSGNGTDTIGNNNTTSNLVGVWLCTYAKLDCGGGDLEEYTESQGITWTFKSDETVNLRNAVGDTMTASYAYKNGVITLMGQSYNVVNLTSTTLVLKYTGKCTEDWTFRKSETFEGIWTANSEEFHFKKNGTLECYDRNPSDGSIKLYCMGHYTLNGNKLTLVYDDSDPNGDEDVFTVKEKTSTRIVLNGESGEDIVIILTQK